MNSPYDALDLATFREAQSCAPERAGILGFTALLKTHDACTVTVGAMYTPLPPSPWCTVGVQHFCLREAATIKISWLPNRLVNRTLGRSIRQERHFS